MDKAVFVLVHGAWHGGWCWHRLSRRLRSLGHDVYAPTLAGCGFRANSISPDITLTAHIHELIQFLFYEDLRNVALVGHSYGGMVIAGAKHTLTDRVTSVIWLDAFLPDDGDSVASLAPDPSLVDIANARGDGYRVPPLSSASGFGISDSAEAVWTDARLTDQPLSTFTDSVSLPPVEMESMRNSFILTTTSLFPDFAIRARSRGYAVVERTDWGHNSMQTHPEELALLLTTLID